MRNRLSVSELESGLYKGDKAVLSKAITLVESSLLKDQEEARILIERILPSTGKSIRIGITGVPGAGKSTFIEAIGKKLTASGHKVAVLAVDPSSQVSGGSILGDKTRMEELSKDPNAYIRPSPTRSDSGGIAGKTRESILLCEAAGFDIILIETVGVGQVEMKVKSLVDIFILLLLTGGGDELQMIKKGIMEAADLIIVNKADGNNIAAAEKLKSEIEFNLPVTVKQDSHWKIQVATCSSVEGKGLDEIQKVVINYIDFVKSNGYFLRNRKDQDLEWMQESLMDLFKEEIYNNLHLKSSIKEIENKVLSGEISSLKAATRILEIFKAGRF